MKKLIANTFILIFLFLLSFVGTVFLEEFFGFDEEYIIFLVWALIFSSLFFLWFLFIGYRGAILIITEYKKTLTSSQK